MATPGRWRIHMLFRNQTIAPDIYEFMSDFANPGVSIVIPTKNGGPGFQETLAMIRKQTWESEILVVDSGSNDGTMELARQFGAHTISISPESFNHGETRNLGIRNTHGDFCVMLVQDAVPVGETWLRDLMQPFSDERVVGVTVRQTPRPESDPVGRWQVEYRNKFLGDTLQVQEIQSWQAFLALGFQERLRLVSFDNVCSALRRDYWQKCPFQTVAFAEDLDWAMRAMAEGKRLVYNPSVSVIHSHNRPPEYHLRRSYVSGRVVPKILRIPPADPGVCNERDFLELLGALYGEVKTMLQEDINDWRGFRRTSSLERGFWNDLLAAAGRWPPPLNNLRDTFYFVVEQIAGVCRRTQNERPWSYILTHALAQSVGPFVAAYYNWCEDQGIVSDGLRRLDHALAAGV